MTDFQKAQRMLDHLLQVQTELDRQARRVKQSRPPAAPVWASNGWALSAEGRLAECAEPWSGDGGKRRGKR